LRRRWVKNEPYAHKSWSVVLQNSHSKPLCGF
jgi:hypothetical protein